jgi:hypothetical protein
MYNLCQEDSSYSARERVGECAAMGAGLPSTVCNGCQLDLHNRAQRSVVIVSSYLSHTVEPGLSTGAARSDIVLQPTGEGVAMCPSSVK